MLLNNIPCLMVSAFLLLTLSVAFISVTRQLTTLHEYAVANKQFTTATLVATRLATTWGADALVRDIEQVYNLGMYWICFSLLSFSDILFIIYYLSLRMGPFM